MARNFAVFFVALIFYITPYLWSPFASRGQAREAVVVMNMLEQHNFVLPLRNGAEIPSKPPLFHWATLPFVFANQGQLTEFAMRIPSALFGALGVVTIFSMTQPAFTLVEAGLTSLVLATSLEWVRSANLARVDMVFSFFVVAAWLAFVSAVEARLNADRRYRSRILVTGVATGLSILAKGPAALLFIGAFAVIYSVLVVWKTPGQRFFKLFPLPILLVAAIISLSTALAWYVPAYLVGGESFLNVALLRENVGRIVDVEGIDPGHRKPFFYSLIYLFQDFLPWTLFFPFTALQLRRDWPQYSPAKKRLLFASLIWVGLFLGAVTVSSSKRTVYLLPALPALAILFSASLRSTRPRYLGFTLLTGFLAALLTIGSVGLLWEPVRELVLSQAPERYAESIRRIPQLIGESTIAGCGLISATFLLLSSAQSFFFGRLTRGVSLLGFAWATIALAANYSILPALERANSPQPFAEQVVNAIPEAAPLYYYQDDFYSVIFYMHRNIPLLTNFDQLGTGRPAYVLLRRAAVESFVQAVPGSELLMESQESAFYGKDKLAVVAITR